MKCFHVCMYKPGKSHNIVQEMKRMNINKEMKRMNINILGVCGWEMEAATLMTI